MPKDSANLITIVVSFIIGVLISSAYWVFQLPERPFHVDQNGAKEQVVKRVTNGSNNINETQASETQDLVRIAPNDNSMAQKTASSNQSGLNYKDDLPDQAPIVTELDRQLSERFDTTPGEIGEFIDANTPDTSP